MQRVLLTGDNYNAHRPIQVFLNGHPIFPCELKVIRSLMFLNLAAVGADVS